MTPSAPHILRKGPWFKVKINSVSVFGMNNLNAIYETYKQVWSNL